MSKGINPSYGINEMKILEFIVAGNSYGLNIFDVKEILTYSEPTSIPNSHPCIEGFIIPRDFLITVINLAKCLDIPENSVTSEDRLILIGKDEQNIALHVDSVAGIHNIVDTDIMEPDEEASTSLKEAVSGVLNTGNRQIEILDIEAIDNYIKLSLVN